MIGVKTGQHDPLGPARLPGGWGIMDGKPAPRTFKWFHITWRQLVMVTDSGREYRGKKKHSWNSVFRTSQQSQGWLGFIARLNPLQQCTVLTHRSATHLKTEKRERVHMFIIFTVNHGMRIRLLLRLKKKHILHKPKSESLLQLSFSPFILVPH